MFFLMPANGRSELLGRVVGVCISSYQFCCLEQLAFFLNFTGLAAAFCCVPVFSFHS